MDAISFSSARTNLAATMDRVCSNHDPPVITRTKAPAAVLLSLEDDPSLEEIAYLLRRSATARRLFTTMDPHEGSHGPTWELPKVTRLLSPGSGGIFRREASGSIPGRVMPRRDLRRISGREQIPQLMGVA